jgi:homoserine/homoserine lactone efflux protein
MSLPQYLSFIAFTLFMFMTPGPVVIFSVHNGLNYGRNKALVASLGNVSALFTLLIIAAASLRIATTISPKGLVLLQLLGAGYLVFLGAKMILNAKNFNRHNSDYKLDISLGTLYRRGFFMTLTNPKAFAYLMAVIPQFLMSGHDLIPQLLIMAPTIAAAQFLCIGTYVMFAHHFREWFLSSKRIELINYIAGGILVLFGLVMAIE